MGPRFGTLLVVLLVAVTAVAAWAGRSQPPAQVAARSLPPTSVPVPPPQHIIITNNPDQSIVGQYVPATYTTHVGQAVIFLNEASTAHTAVADNGAFTSPVLSPGQSYIWTPSQPGIYSYSCYIHPGMHGGIIVQP